MSMTLDDFCNVVELDYRPVGIYDAPEPASFAPLTDNKRCIFDHFDDWQQGKTIDITAATKTCPGCSYWMTGINKFPTWEAYVDFLTVKEGLRATPELMDSWLKAHPPYRPAHGHILIGPVKPELSAYLKTVTFFVNPDQLSVLMLGASYHAHPGDLAPVIAPFGSGCGQMLTMFSHLEKPQAIIGATDIAMRDMLPPDCLAFTVTVPMLDRLLSLDKERSFLGKPFLNKLRAARR